VRVIFSPKFEGLFKATLELVFYHSQLSAWFAVRRSLRGIAGSLEDHRHLGSLGQEHREPTENNPEIPPRKIILLFPSDQNGRLKRIPDYEVPPIVQHAVNNSTAACPYDKNAPHLVSALRPESLIMNTYAHYFEALLNVEDGHQQSVRSGRWEVLCRPANEVDAQERGQLYRSVSLFWPSCILLIIIYVALRSRTMTKIFYQKWSWEISFG
jgi:hypothetical protein